MEERTNYSMKLIMENWRKYLVEGQLTSPEGIDLEFLEMVSRYGSELNEGPRWNKFKKAALGLGAAGALAAAGLGDISSKEVSPETGGDEVSLEQGITDMPSFGSIKKPLSMTSLAAQYDWSQAPTGGNYTWMSPDQIEGHFYLPNASVSAKDYKTVVEQWSIKDLHKHLFGSSGQWGGKAMTLHPETGQKMLPPAWSVEFGVYKQKVEEKISKILQDVSERGEETVAKELGGENATWEGIEKKLMHLQSTIQTK